MCLFCKLAMSIKAGSQRENGKIMNAAISLTLENITIYSEITLENIKILLELTLENIKFI